jgi:hypothetical protein
LSIGVSFLEVIDQFLFIFTIDAQLELSFFGPQHDRLSLHPSHHVERCPWHPAQGHFQDVIGNSRRHRFAQLRGHLEVTVCWAHAPDPLMRPFVVVIGDPEPDPIPCRFKTIERGPG